MTTDTLASLRNEKYVSLATLRKNGRMVSTPVWFVEGGGCLHVFTLNNSGKIKRLRNFSRSRVAACDVRGRVHGEWIEAETTIMDDPEAIAQAHRLFRRKYPFSMRIGDLLSRLTGRYRRRAWLRVELKS